MNDLNFFNKRKCESCLSEIEFFWYRGIYNNKEFARLCIECKEDLLKTFYQKKT